MNYIIEFIARIPMGLLAWLPTILFLMLIIFGFLLGLWRGYRKSKIFLIKTLLAIAITFILYAVLFLSHPEVFNERVVSIINMIAGEGFVQDFFGVDQAHASLGSITTQMLINSLGEVADLLSPEILETYISALVQSIVGMLVFVIFVIIYWIINHIILYILYLIFLSERRKRKRVNRQYKRGLRDEPYQGKRLRGGIVGVVGASIKGLVYFSFFLFFAHIITGDNFGDVIENESGEEISAEMMAISNIYNFFRVSGNTGISGFLNNFRNSNNVPWILMIADMTARGTIEDENGDEQYVLLREELAAITNITNVMIEYIIRHNLIVVNSDNDLDFERVLTILIEDDTFEETLTAAVEQFANTNTIRGLSRHILDSLFVGFVRDSQNEILLNLFGEEESPLVLTQHLLNEHNFGVVFNTSLRVLRLLDSINNDLENNTFMPGIFDLLGALSNHAKEVTDVLNTLLELSFLNGKDNAVTDALNSAIGKLFASTLANQVNVEEELLIRAFKQMPFIDEEKGASGGEIGAIFNVVGDLIQSGIFNYLHNFQENIGPIVTALTQTNEGEENEALIGRMLRDSRMLYFTIAIFITDFEVMDGLRVTLPNANLVEFVPQVNIISQLDILITVHALAALGDDIDFSVFFGDNVNVLDVISNLEQSHFDALFESRILQSLLAQMLASNSVAMLSIPSGFQFLDEEGNIVNQSVFGVWIDTWNIDEKNGNKTTIPGEASIFLEAIFTLDILDILKDMTTSEDDVKDSGDTMEFDMTIILQRVLDLSEDQIKSLFTSVVLRFMVSDLLIETTFDMGVIVPIAAVEYHEIAQEQMILQDEFVDFFTATVELLNALGDDVGLSDLGSIFEGEDLTTLLIDKLLTSDEKEAAPVKALLESLIFSATLGYQLLLVMGENLNIPRISTEQIAVIANPDSSTSDEQPGSLVSRLVDNDDAFVQVITQGELDRLVDALVLIVESSGEQLDFNEPTQIVSIIFNVLKDPNNTSTIFDSKILIFTISTQLIEQADGMLLIPADILLPFEEPVNFISRAESLKPQYFIDSEELVALINIISSFIADDNGDIDLGNLDQVMDNVLKLIKDDVEKLIEFLEDSEIFRITVGNLLIDTLPEDVIVIPYEVLRQEDVLQSSNDSEILRFTKPTTRKYVVTLEELKSLLRALIRLPIDDLLPSTNQPDEEDESILRTEDQGNGFDINAILDLLGDEKVVDELLKSQIITTTINYMIFKMLLETDSMVLPIEVRQEMDILGRNDGPAVDSLEIIEDNEFDYLIKALPLLTDVLEDIGNFDIILDLLTDPEDFKTLTNSAVILASVSNVIVPMLVDFDFVIPNDEKVATTIEVLLKESENEDEDIFYRNTSTKQTTIIQITIEELESLVHALNVLKTASENEKNPVSIRNNMSSSKFSAFDPLVIFDLIAENDQESLDKIFESKIIFVGFRIMLISLSEEGDLPLEIPQNNSDITLNVDVLDLDVQSGSRSVEVITEEEFDKLLDSLGLLLTHTDDMASIEFSTLASILHGQTEKNVDALLGSYILSYTLRGQIVDLTEGDIKIPSHIKEDDRRITQEELRALLMGMSFIITEDEENRPTINLADIDIAMMINLAYYEQHEGFESSNLYIMLNSYILWLTISDIIEQTGLTIPFVAIDNDFTNGENNEMFITKFEIINLMNSIRIIFGNDDLPENIFDEISPNRLIELATDDQGSLDVVLESYIIWLAVSDIITDSIDDVPQNVIIHIPSVLEGSNLKAATNEFIVAKEINALLIAVDTLLAGNIYDFDFTDIPVNPNLLIELANSESNPSGNTLLHTVLHSQIIWVTISNILIDLVSDAGLPGSNNPVRIPQSVIDVEMSVDVIQVDEIINFTKGFGILFGDTENNTPQPLNSDDSFEIDADAINIVTNVMMLEVLESKILHTTLSNIFIDIENIIITTNVMVGEGDTPTPVELFSPSSQTAYQIIDTQIAELFGALNTFFAKEESSIANLDIDPTNLDYSKFSNLFVEGEDGKIATQTIFRTTLSHILINERNRNFARDMPEYTGEDRYEILSVFDLEEIENQSILVFTSEELVAFMEIVSSVDMDDLAGSGFETIRELTVDKIINSHVFWIFISDIILTSPYGGALGTLALVELWSPEQGDFINEPLHEVLTKDMLAEVLLIISLYPIALSY